MKILFKILKSPLTIILIVLLGLYFILNKFKLSSFFVDFFKPISSAGAKISDLKSKQIADSLHISMGSIGTDFETIKRVLKGLTKADYIKVYNDFGSRPYIDLLGVGADFGIKFNLSQWFNSELSDKQKLELNSLYSEFLSI